MRSRRRDAVDAKGRQCSRQCSELRVALGCLYVLGRASWSYSNGMSRVLVVFD